MAMTAHAFPVMRVRMVMIALVQLRQQRGGQLSLAVHVGAIAMRVRMMDQRGAGGGHAEREQRRHRRAEAGELGAKASHRELVFR